MFVTVLINQQKMYNWEALNRTYAFKSVYILRGKVISRAEM